MSFEEFKEKVMSFIDEANYNNPRFFNDEGKHVARCGDVTIVGNSMSRVLMVNWGHGHKAAVNV